MRLPHSLRARLILANLVVAGVALGTVLVAVSLVGPGYFADAMGHLPGDPVDGVKGPAHFSRRGHQELDWAHHLGFDGGQDRVVWFAQNNPEGPVYDLQR